MATALEAADLSVATVAIIGRALAIVESALAFGGHAVGIVTGKTFGAGGMVLSSTAIIKTRVWASFNQLAMRSPY